jgi:hypothetical protein
MQKILFLLTSCIFLAGTLLLIGPNSPVKVFSSDHEFEEFVLKQVYDFGYPHQRVRTRNVFVNESFSRQIITIDIDQRFPRTLFHKTIADSLRPFGVSTYGVVQLTEPVTEIHLIQQNTVTKTIRLIRNS